MPTSVSPPNLGPLLNERRKASGLTLQDLATASGVSRSMLSQIERGEANPTFSTLWNITRALGISVDDLTRVEATDASVIDVLLDHYTPEIRTPDGLCVLRILSPAEAAGTTEWYMLMIEPGGELASDAHAVGSTEHLTVLKGQLAVRAANGEALVESGETARYRADTVHSISNRTADVAQALLVVMSG